MCSWNLAPSVLFPCNPPHCDALCLCSHSLVTWTIPVESAGPTDTLVLPQWQQSMTSTISRTTRFPDNTAAGWDAQRKCFITWALTPAQWHTRLDVLCRGKPHKRSQQESELFLRVCVYVCMCVCVCVCVYNLNCYWVKLRYQSFVKAVSLKGISSYISCKICLALMWGTYSRQYKLWKRKQF